MSCLRVGVASVTMVVSAIAVPVVFTGGRIAVAAPDPTVEVACPEGTLSGTTYTPKADCDTTVPLTVPDSQTVNGSGHTIAANDPSGSFFNGAVLTNVGTSMNIEDLTINGDFAPDFSCGPPGFSLIGVYFNDASGTVDHVKVENTSQHTGCNTGLGLQANAVNGIPRTVTITKTVVSGYRKPGWSPPGR